MSSDNLAHMTNHRSITDLVEYIWSRADSIEIWLTDAREPGPRQTDTETAIKHAVEDANGILTASVELQTRHGLSFDPTPGQEPCVVAADDLRLVIQELLENRFGTGADEPVALAINRIRGLLGLEPETFL